MKNEPIYILSIRFQSINNCWGVLYRRGVVVENIVNESLEVALKEMANFIEKDRITDHRYDIVNLQSNPLSPNKENENNEEKIQNNK